MPDINLLQNTNITEKDNTRLFRMLNVLGVILLVLAIAAFVGLFILTKSIESRAVTVADQKIQLEKEIKSKADYSILSKDQSKMNNLKIVLDQHLNWSEVLPKFAKATLKTANYTKFVANKDGSATITGTVPDFQNLDRLIQAYQLKEFDYIKDVSLANISLQTEGKNVITYILKVTFNKDILKQ
jgi:hypothetical protein